MNNTAAIHRGIVQAIRWLAQARCLLCRSQHNTARAICADCKAAFSRNRHACHRCTLPLETTHSLEVNRLAFAQQSAQTLCPTCIRHSPTVISARAPYLMRTDIRDLIHLWKFQNRPQLSSLLADLLVNDLPQAAKNLVAPESTASQRVLVPIPTQWRHQVSRGFDHTWLLAQAIRARHAEQMVVRLWLRNRRFRPPQHELSRRERLSDAKSRFRAHPKVAGHHITLLDDVMTTGAKVRGAADASRHTGARSVEIWRLARTPAPSTAR